VHDRRVLGESGSGIDPPDGGQRDHVPVASEVRSFAGGARPIDHSGAEAVVLTSLEFPHRYADAYLRDSLLNGVVFDRSDLGKSLLASSLADASALYAQLRRTTLELPAE
jgi:hypothetical protein